MNLAEHYRQLLHYDAWANQQVIEALHKAGTAPARSLQLLAHVISAEQLWLARITGKEQPFPVWPEFALDRCAREADTIAGLWRQYFKQLPGVLEQDVTYRNSKGEIWTSRVRDILVHVFVHSAYHRGQIAANMREAGCIPAYTDFIHAVRQGLVE